MRNILMLILFTAAVSPGFPLLPEDLVGVKRAAALRASDEPLTEVQIKNPGPKLLPNHSGLQRFITENMNSLEPNILVESLFLYRKPSAGANGEGWSETERNLLFNRMVALSSLAGIEYYSASRKAMRVFYESSRIIESPANKNPLPDPVFAAAPDSLTLYARQKDLTFGENVYRFDYHAGTDAIFFLQENLTSMSAGIIPAIGKNRLKTVFALIDTEDSVLLYAAAMAKTASLAGMGNRIGASFSNRAKAIIRWFTVRADGVFEN